MTQDRREYLRNYQRAWVSTRRKKWLNRNGPCVICGSWRKLEVDHIDPSEKVYESARIWSLSQPKREAELAKCQVLCHRHHAEKTNRERRLSGLYKRLQIKSPAGMAWCYRGKHHVAVANFTKNKAKRDGLEDECKNCRSKRRNKKKKRIVE